MITRTPLRALLALALISLPALVRAQVSCPQPDSGQPVPIPCLPNGTAPGGSEVLPAYQSGREVKLTTEQLGLYAFAGGGTLGSAVTTDLGSVPSAGITITGTATITSFGTSAAAGTIKLLRFAAAATLGYNATSLILPGAANITAAANDFAIAEALGSGNWILLAYQRASGQSLVFPTGAQILAQLGAQGATSFLAGPTPSFRAIAGTDLPLPTSSSLGGVEALTAPAHQWLTGIGTSGVPSAAQPACGDLSNAGTACPANLGTSGSAVTQASGNNSWSAGQAVAPVALTDASSIAVNAALGNYFTVTLGGNRTLANPTNLLAGQALLFAVTQDGTGSRTLAYGGNYKWPSGTAPTLSTAAAAVDVISCVAISTSVLYCNSALNEH